MQAGKFGCQFKCFQVLEMEGRALHAECPDRRIANSSCSCTLGANIWYWNWDSLYLQANPHIFIAHSAFCCFSANRIWSLCTKRRVDTGTDAPCKTLWDQTAKQPKERSLCKVCLEHHIQLTPACAIKEKLMIRGKLIPDDHSDQNSWTYRLLFLFSPCTQRESLLFLF